MQSEDLELEAELRRLPLRAPTPELLARLEQELGTRPGQTQVPAYTSATNWSSWKWRVWTSATAATAVLVVVLIFGRARSPGVIASPPAAANPAQVLPDDAPDLYKPIRADNVLYSTEDEGRVTLADGTPARRVRAQYVDTVTWKNPRTNASVSWSVPREEVRVVPIAFQ